MDIKEIDSLLNTFSYVSGLNITLADSRFRQIAKSGSELWDFCTEIHRSKKCLDCCMKSDISSFRITEERRKNYIYTCPFGIVCVIAPIIEDDAVSGYLIISPGADKKQYERHYAETFELTEELAPELNRSTLESCIMQLPVHNNEKIQALSDTLALFAQHIGREGFVKDDYTLGELIKDYINKNFQRKITLAELSMNIHCSTVSLTEHFKKEFGITIMQYVMKKRMELSKKLLAETPHYTIKEISEKCGFSDVEYFSRCFKRYNSVSPSKWRSRIQAY